MSQWDKIITGELFLFAAVVVFYPADICAAADPDAKLRLSGAKTPRLTKTSLQ